MIGVIRTVLQVGVRGVAARLWCAGLSCLLIGGCAAEGVAGYGRAPVLWRVCEKKATKPPAVRVEGRWAAAARRGFVEPLDRLLSLERNRQARNINALDMVPDSSWFVNRLGLGSARELYTGRSATAVPGGELDRFRIAEGPASTAGPSALGKWKVVRAGRDRAGPYLAIRDERRNHFLLRFDARQWPGLATSSELVATLMLHAAGYRVPERHMVFFLPGRLRLASSARWSAGRPLLAYRKPEDAGAGDGAGTGGASKPLTRPALLGLLAAVPRMADGSVRAVATRLVKGRPLGPFPLHGRRRDDPNDRIAHQHLRELRGLRLIAAWLNLFDLSESSSADIFRNGRVVHLLTSLRGALGGTAPGTPKGLADSLGGVAFPRGWMRDLADARLFALRRWPALGFFTAAGFRPDLWQPRYRHPAFARATARDLFWAGRILAAFDEEKIRAVVEAAMLPKPAAALMTKTLAARARRAARYGLSRSGPFGFFRVVRCAAGYCFCGTDLYRQAGFDGRGGAVYRVRLVAGSGRRRVFSRVRGERAGVCVPLDVTAGRFKGGDLATVVSLRRTSRPSAPVRVHIRFDLHGKKPKVVGVERL